MIQDRIKNNIDIEKIRIPEKDSDSSSALNIFNRLNFVDSDLGFLGGPQKRNGFKLSLWMWLSATIDALIIMSLSCLVMLCFSFAVKKEFKDILGFMLIKENLSLTFAVLFLFTGWMYFITTRVVTGASVGEWTCSLRVGQPHERLQQYYLGRVIIRTTLTLLTGIVLFPLLSLIFRKDLSGRISRLYIYSLK